MDFPSRSTRLMRKKWLPKRCPLTLTLTLTGRQASLISNCARAQFIWCCRWGKSCANTDGGVPSIVPPKNLQLGKCMTFSKDYKQDARTHSFVTYATVEPFHNTRNFGAPQKFLDSSSKKSATMQCSLFVATQQHHKETREVEITSFAISFKLGSHVIPIQRCHLVVFLCNRMSLPARICGTQCRECSFGRLRRRRRRGSYKQHPFRTASTATAKTTTTSTTKTATTFTRCDQRSTG